MSTGRLWVNLQAHYDPWQAMQQEQQKMPPLQDTQPDNLKLRASLRALGRRILLLRLMVQFSSTILRFVHLRFD
jgi:hypothetical protein